MFLIFTEESDGEMIRRGEAETITKAKAKSKYRRDANDVVYIKDGAEVVRTWVPDEDADEDGKGTWAVGDAFKEGRDTVWFDEAGNEHKHEE